MRHVIDGTGQRVDLPDDEAAWQWVQLNEPEILLQYPKTADDALRLVDGLKQYAVVFPETPKEEAVPEVARIAHAVSLLGRTHHPDLREHRVLHEGDPEAVALAAAGAAVTPANRAALRGFVAMGEGSLTKSLAEPAIPAGKNVVPLVPEAAHAAKDVREAFAARTVRKANLGGRHSGGALLADASSLGAVLLLKPDSALSPAAGIAEEGASQPRREAGFFHAMEFLGLGRYAPRCDLIVIDGREYSAMNFAGPDYESLADLLEKDAARVHRVMTPLLQDGTLHKLAAVDYALGQADRHNNNALLNSDDQFRLIDEGTTFAGPDFNPVHDPATFVPGYLRLWGRWPSKGTPKEKFEVLPRLQQRALEEVGTWLHGLDLSGLGVLLARYGVSPAASLYRFVKLQRSPGLRGAPIDAVINWAWTVGL